MPNNYPAFSAGEHVMFANLETLQKVQGKYGVNGPQGQKWIHDLLPNEMTIHHGKYVRIKGVSIYHMGTVLYEFDEVEDFWLEDCIVDRSLADPSDDQLDSPADQFYEVITNSEDRKAELVIIKGIHDHQVYSSLRKNNPKQAMLAIRVIAKLRTKGNFENLFGFDGFYG